MQTRNWDVLHDLQIVSYRSFDQHPLPVLSEMRIIFCSHTVGPYSHDLSPFTTANTETYDKMAFSLGGGKIIKMSFNHTSAWKEEIIELTCLSHHKHFLLLTAHWHTLFIHLPIWLPLWQARVFPQTQKKFAVMLHLNHCFLKLNAQITQNKYAWICMLHIESALLLKRCLLILPKENSLSPPTPHRQLWIQ